MAHDIASLFDDVTQGARVEIRDPLLDPYGNTSKATKSQREAWDFFHENLGKTYIDKNGEQHIIAPRIGMVGAKGSSKTHLGGCVGAHMIQAYPGSVGCLMSNSYQQAKDNGGPILIKIIEQLGYSIEFYTQKKVGSRSFTNFYMITLAPGVYSFVLVRSFDAISRIEGAEIDWGWGEEIQDADKAAFVVFTSRIRGQGSPNVICSFGMPEPATHWQYKMLPNLGFQLADEYTGPQEVELPDGGMSVRVGKLWEPSVFENKQNVGAQYIQTLLDSYSKEDADRYVYGKRGATRGDRVFYSYRDDLHRRGNMSKLLCEYEPQTKLIFAYDFNVYPMSCGVFQPKLWNDKWDDLILDPKLGWMNPVDGVSYDSPEDYCPPNRTVFAQVDELEVYPDNPEGGMTRGMVLQLEKRYVDHAAPVVVVGDASGNQRRSSSETTDWLIIAQSMKNYRQPIVIRGLIANNDLKTGRTKYSNPSQRDALMNANRMLLDANGSVNVCFLPESKLESGGIASAVTALGFTADGGFDTRLERKMDRDIPRSHFADIYKYFAWYAMPPNSWTGKEHKLDRHIAKGPRKQTARMESSRSGWIN